MTRPRIARSFGVRDLYWLGVVLVLLLKNGFQVSINSATLGVSDAVQEEKMLAPRREDPWNNGKNLTNSSGAFVQELAMHVLLALSGNHSGFFEEVEVLLKSLLMNAPLNRPLTIHVMADADAFEVLPNLFWNDTREDTRRFDSSLHLWRSGQPIAVETYNIQPHIIRWERRIKQLYRRGNLGINFARRELEYHTIGTWFRLLADEVLPSDVSHVLYMDVDIVLLANCGELWDYYLDDTKWFQWGSSAGFVILDIQSLPSMWQSVKDFGIGNARKHLIENEDDSAAASIADQLFLQALQLAQPDKVGKLPSHWDNTMTENLWKWKTRLVQKRPKIGYIHFNGGGYTKHAWFRGDDDAGNFSLTQSRIDNKYLDAEPMKSSFGIADYYIRLDWRWARHFAASRIPKTRPLYNIRIQHGHD